MAVVDEGKSGRAGQIVSLQFNGKKFGFVESLMSVYADWRLRFSTTVFKRR